MSTGLSIRNKYVVENLIGNGKFGKIFRGHIEKKNTVVAIKMEPCDGDFKSIKHEVTILNYLYKRGCRNIPFIYWYGIDHDHICMVMNYFPTSLSIDYIPNLQLETFMIKCMDVFQHIHAHYVIHRDIKPQNIMFDEHGELHLIDFGLATVYVDDEHRHIECSGCSQSYILGTPKYISYHVHDGYVPSRRDDLISIGYLYLYLKYGTLPWDGLTLPIENLSSSFTELHVLHPHNQYRKEKKDWTHLSAYLLDNGEHRLQKYLDYCYRLEFASEPHYSGLQKLFTIQ
jgi:serine/threonine protein kinase